MEVKELIVPLCDYSQSVLEEGYDDEETANRWEVSGSTRVSRDVSE